MVCVVAEGAIGSGVALTPPLPSTMSVHDMRGEVPWPIDRRESSDPRPARAMRDAGSPVRSCREIPAPILQPVCVADRPSCHLLTLRPKCSFSTGRAPRAEKKGAARSPSARGSGRSNRQTRKPRRQAVTTDPFGSHFRASKEAVETRRMSELYVYLGNTIRSIQPRWSRYTYEIIPQRS